MLQAGIIVSDYPTRMVEILKDNARPEAGEVYRAMDMAWSRPCSSRPGAIGSKQPADSPMSVLLFPRLANCHLSTGSEHRRKAKQRCTEEPRIGMDTSGAHRTGPANTEGIAGRSHRGLVRCRRRPGGAQGGGRRNTRRNGFTVIPTPVTRPVTKPTRMAKAQTCS